MTATVGQILPILERLAPVRLAESWDNVGLQVGSRHWPVNAIWTALDPLPEVVAGACDHQVGLLVTHHPLFFKPLKQIDVESPVGRIVHMALSHRLSIYSAHTNLDSVRDGVNDTLARRIGLEGIRAMSGGMGIETVKLVVFVPRDHSRAILDTLFAMGAGQIGTYGGCSFRTEGTGTFLPDADANPSVGVPGIVNEVGESRIEVRLPAHELERAVAALKKVHPYETMAYDAYPLPSRDPAIGLGRIGHLPAAMPLGDLARRIKQTLGLAAVKVVGEAGRAVRQVALCSGSGGSLLGAAAGSGADVYVSGDLGYHTARDAQQAGIALIDAGHFGSEQLIVPVLADAIGRALDAAGIDATVSPTTMEKDPFHYL